MPWESMNKKHTDMINKAIRKVPARLRDDAFQAGCVGLVRGLEKSELYSHDNPDGYVYTCIRNEVMREIAALNPIYALDVRTFSELLKLKKAKAYGLDPASEGLSIATVEQLERILRHKRQ